MMLIHSNIQSNQENWDFRVLATVNQGDIRLAVHKVYLDRRGDAKAYDDQPIRPIGTVSYLQTIYNTSKKPVLWKGTRFPEAYSMTTT